MPKALVTSGPPLVEIVNGKRILSRDLKVDLGERFNELELWAAYTGHDSGPDWCVGHTPEGTTVIRVQKGFAYDGASIPGWAQSLIMGPKENYEIAGCVHDLLYRLQAPRGVSDGVFRWIARSGEKCVGAVRGFVGWLTLRGFGWWAYRNNGKK